MNSNELSRREFLKRVLALSAAAAMPTILTKNTLTAARPKPRIVGPNERVNLACCGIGNQGLYDIRELYKTGEANIVAFCDVDMGAPQTLPILQQLKPNRCRFGQCSRFLALPDLHARHVGRETRLRRKTDGTHLLRGGTDDESRKEV